MVWDESCFKGKTVLIEFWATWCEPCKQMVPVLDSIWQENKGKGLTFLSVSVDRKRKDFDSFVKATPFPNPTLLDDRKTFQAWHVIAIPAIYLVKEGQIVAQWSGVAAKADIARAVRGE
jgi:thioredoxin-like negative regulator of GroEL